jgi:hypothetical protein
MGIFVYQPHELSVALVFLDAEGPYSVSIDKAKNTLYEQAKEFETGTFSVAMLIADWSAECSDMLTECMKLCRNGILYRNGESKGEVDVSLSASRNDLCTMISYMKL